MTEAENFPLVSVVIATRNRAEMLRASIHSVLCQTYSNIEVIVVDDGSTDNTRELVASIDDSRVVYAFQPPAGISAARNLGTDCANGQWIAVHDDDDIMMPNRISDQLDFADAATDFVYGSFINFDDETGALQLHHGRNYGYGPAVMSGFAPGHSTWLVRTALLKRFRYDTGIESAVDNNLAFRMLRSGVRFRHSGVMCLLRRVHGGRITDVGGAGQKYVAQLNLNFIKRGISESHIKELSKEARRDWGPLDKTKWETRYLAFLPDHLVKRHGYIVQETRIRDDVRFNSVAAVRRFQIVDVSDLNWFEFMFLCKDGVSSSDVWARLREEHALEDALSGNVSEPQVLKVDSRQVCASVAIKDSFTSDIGISSEDNYSVLVSAHEEDWQHSELQNARYVFLTEADGREFIVALFPQSSYTSARKLLEERQMGGKAEYRLLSRSSITDIRDDVDRYLTAEDSEAVTPSRTEEVKK